MIVGINRFANAINWMCVVSSALQIKADEVNHSPFSLLNDFALTRTTKLPSATFSVMLA